MNFLSYIMIAVGAALGIAFSYLVIVPLERRDARSGYVVEARATAAEAKSAELARQVAAGKLVAESYQEILKNARAKDAENDAQLAKDRAEFEAKLKAAGRGCGLDASDLDWLHN